jgi:hypothetical protein
VSAAAFDLKAAGFGCSMPFPLRPRRRSQSPPRHQRQGLRPRRKKARHPLDPVDAEPTGYITEIANLVPSCGKCNQSKGKSYWRTWMEGNARLSPKTRAIPDLAERAARLQSYEVWRQPRKIDFAAIVGPEMWQQHRQNWRSILKLLKSSQALASEIQAIVAKNVPPSPPSTPT